MFGKLFSWVTLFYHFRKREICILILFVHVVYNQVVILTLQEMNVEFLLSKIDEFS